ncbi:MAG: methyltransferase domain-containing protein [Saprospiraceae bacterium]|nr:methyltransferase domain-containing protein [Saprospiraceae bacterium]
MEKLLSADSWEERYKQGYTGWDLGHISGAMKVIIDGLEHKDARILVPGAGNGFEVAYLWERGFKNVYLLDWAKSPLDNFAKKYPDFPKAQLLQRDFFDLKDQYDLILEQTFFCALYPAQREAYAKKMHEILGQNGLLKGVLFSVPMYDNRPPYGGSTSDYLTLFSTLFDIIKLEPCQFSEPDRMEMEVEIEMRKK